MFGKEMLILFTEITNFPCRYFLIGSLVGVKLCLAGMIDCNGKIYKIVIYAF